MLFGCVAGMSTAFGHLAGHVTAGNFLNLRVSCGMKTEAKTLILVGANYSFFFFFFSSLAFHLLRAVDSV